MENDARFEQICSNLRKEHPDWDEEQVKTYAAILYNAEDVIEDGGEVPAPINELWDIILKKVYEWIEKNLPTIFEKVANFLKNLLSSLPNWVNQGIDYILKLISKMNF